jgi:hypothetical protein
MSTLDPPEDLDPNNPQYYAPRWLRARPDEFPATQPLSEEEERARRTDFGSWRRVHDAEVLERAVAEALQRSHDRLPVQDSLAAQDSFSAKEFFPAQEFPPAYKTEALPRQQTGNRAVFGVAARFTAAVCVAAGVASFFVIMVPASRDLARPAGGGASYLPSLLQSIKTNISSFSQKQIATEVLARDDGGATNDPLPPAVNVAALRPGPAVNPATVNPITLNPTAVNPTSLPASLQLTTGVAPVAAAKIQTATAEVASVPQNTARQLPPDEIAALLKRGEELASSGDFAAARLLFQRAAEAHDARAALALAATFDPIVIKQIGANPALQDVASARTWYQRASEWGSAQASRKLEALASAGR